MPLQTSIPITVITGFLGSGKTTLLSSLLKNKDMANTAVIINEFGKVGLDHALIERTDENIVELQSGCICCTIRGDLHKTLLDLADKVAFGKVQPFDKVVIETTGLADPVPIIHTLMTSLDIQRIYTLDGVITLVDAVNGEETLVNHPESVKQVALADRIIISKTDISSLNTQESLVKCLQDINPSVSIIKAVSGDVPASSLFALGIYNPSNKSQNAKEWLAAEKFEEESKHDEHHHHHDVNRHGKEIQAFAMTYETPVDVNAFGFFLDLLASQMGADLLRVKGIINVAGEERPAVIHGVQHIFHPLKWLDAWPDNDKRTKLVFIVRNIAKEEIEKFFDALMGAAKANSDAKKAG